MHCLVFITETNKQQKSASVAFELNIIHYGMWGPEARRWRECQTNIPFKCLLMEQAKASNMQSYQEVCRFLSLGCYSLGSFWAWAV